MTETNENLEVKMEDLINIAGISANQIGVLALDGKGPWYSKEVTLEATRRAITRAAAIGEGMKS